MKPTLYRGVALSALRTEGLTHGRAHTVFAEWEAIPRKPVCAVAACCFPFTEVLKGVSLGRFQAPCTVLGRCYSVEGMGKNVTSTAIRNS